MSGAKHTPGPWRSEYPVVYANSSAELLHIDEHDCATVHDARLIAAAPELLEALRVCLDDLKVAGFDATAEQAIAAIAKATGDAIPGLEVSDSNFGAWVDAGGKAP